MIGIPAPLITVVFEGGPLGGHVVGAYESPLPRVIPAASVAPLVSHVAAHCGHAVPAPDDGVGHYALDGSWIGLSPIYHWRPWVEG